MNNRIKIVNKISLRLMAREFSGTFQINMMKLDRFGTFDII